MQSTIKELSKGVLKEMLKDPAAEQYKSHIVQISPDKSATPNPEGKKMVMYAFDSLFN